MPTAFPPFHRFPEKGIRPPGDFFGDTDEEEIVWAHAKEDFKRFGYRRFDPGLPKESPNALWIKAVRDEKPTSVA